MRFIREGNYSLDDIGNIFEKGFLEKNLFSVEKGITGRSLIIKAKEPRIKTFGLNESLIKLICLGIRIPQVWKRIILHKL